ncbi:MAG: DUF1175 family protein [Bacteriovorax sp.]|jgi:uncharacterized protein YfaT (DUF1175 family)|nr:DUF1175 family protein [Bacteriovorax sp.]
MAGIKLGKIHFKIIVILFLGIFYSANSFAEVLNFTQSENFRSWMKRIVEEQLRKGPTPRWTHKDCAGLVRFAVLESFRPHNQKWIKANGFTNENLPPEIKLLPKQKDIGKGWNQTSGEEKVNYISALGLIQSNSTFVSKDLNQARVGDMIFFDQGDAQHLMIWMGNYIAYHTGTVTKKDNGLRSVKINELMNWKDSRWQLRKENPNYIGIYRFSFLAH